MYLLYLTEGNGSTEYAASQKTIIIFSFWIEWTMSKVYCTRQEYCTSQFKYLSFMKRKSQNMKVVVAIYPVETAYCFLCFSLPVGKYFYFLTFFFLSFLFLRGWNILMWNMLQIAFLTRGFKRG